MRRWRLRTLAAIAALLLTAAALLANSRTGPAGALLLAALAGIVLGNLLAERIDRLRGALLERVRPNGERLPGFRVAEITAQGCLVERLVSVSDARPVTLTRCRDDRNHHVVYAYNC